MIKLSFAIVNTCWSEAAWFESKYKFWQELCPLTDEERETLFHKSPRCYTNKGQVYEDLGQGCLTLEELLFDIDNMTVRTRCYSEE